MFRLVLVLSLIFNALSCGSAAQSDAQTAATPAAQATVPKDTVITLERSQCFGTCPSYKLTVYGDGRVVYEGRKFVKVEGTVNDTVTQEQLKQLVAEFERADYFSLRDSYSDARDGCPAYWTDNPSANTSLELGGKKKTIWHYYGCTEKDSPGLGIGVYPKKLYELESKIDEIVNTARWVKGGEKNSNAQQ